MARMQIYLGEDEIRRLDRAERETGAPRSELIRRAIRAAYGGPSTADRIAELRRTSGAWKGRRNSGAEQVEGLRGGLEERMKRLGR